MVSDSEKLKQLKIYYLFMHADGESSLPEKRYLDDILAKSELSEESAQEFRVFCKQMVLEATSKIPEVIEKKIDELLGKRESSPSYSPFPFSVPDFSLLTQQIISRVLYGSLEGSKVLQAQTIWTLINLGYADSEYSEAEKQVVNHLIQRWNTNPVLVAEFNDTADTILALTLQKEWVQKSNRQPADISRIIQELDRSIASMLANVEISISEANIA